MFGWIRKRLTVWAGHVQRKKIARLSEKNLRLKAEIEQEGGKPIKLTHRERRILHESAKGIDTEALKKLSVIDAAEFITHDDGADSIED